MKVAGARLKLSQVNKFYGDTQVLKDIHLEINPGEMVCFLGPSGCGKTTLLRIIAGLEQQSSGQLWQGENEITKAAVKERDFGIVFQSYALFPNMTISDNIAFGLRSQKASRSLIKERVSELLSLVGLEQHALKYPSQISGGQQQRVALARALAPAPGLLLLDEPLSALDAQVRQHLRTEIRQLQQSLGVTTILVTHDQEEALTMADRIVVMNHGVIEQVGTPEEIYNQPASAFVASFIGSMNFLRVEQQPGNLVSIAGQQLALPKPWPSNQPLMLAIRPENIGLAAPNNQLPLAVIQQVEFLGSFVRLELRLDGQKLKVDLDSKEALQYDLTPGKQLAVRLPSSDLHCFAA